MVVMAMAYCGGADFTGRVCLENNRQQCRPAADVCSGYCADVRRRRRPDDMRRHAETKIKQ